MTPFFSLNRLVLKVLCRPAILASALLALLSAATAALWVRSYFVNDWFGRVHYSPGVPTEDHHVWVEANRGLLWVSWGGDPVENFSAVRWELRHLPASPNRHDYPIDEPRYLRAIGIGWQSPRRLITGEMSTGVRVRLALPATVFTLLAILCARPRLRLSRHAEGPTCQV